MDGHRRWLSALASAGVLEILLRPVGLPLCFDHFARLWKRVAPVAGLLLGGFRFEPVELVRVLLVIFLAGYPKPGPKAAARDQGQFLGLSLPEPRYVGPW